MIRLRPVGFEDLETLRKWRNSPEIMKWCRQTNLISYQDQLNWYKKQNDDPSIQMFVIESSLPGWCMAGVCGLTSIDLISKRAEFSCYIAPSFHLKGYAGEALTNLFNYGFYDLNLNLIWGETFDGNPALNLFLSLGMRKEGIRRSFYYKNGKYIDAHLISLLRSEWNLT